MQRRISYLFVLSIPPLSLCTFSYFLISHQITLTLIQIINFSFFSLQTLLTLPFLFLLSFKLTSPAPLSPTLRLLTSKLPSPLLLSIPLLSLLLSIFSFTSIFYQFFVRQRSEGGLWSIQLNIFLSLLLFILSCKTLLLQYPGRMLLYSVYIVFAVLVIVFLAHLKIMTEEPVYMPELCLEVLAVMVGLDVWWWEEGMPPGLGVLVAGMGVVTAEEFVREVVAGAGGGGGAGGVGMRVYRVVVAVLVLMEVGVVGVGLWKQGRRCWGEIYAEGGKDVPLTSVMISQIPLVEFKGVAEIREKNEGKVGNQKPEEQDSNVQMNDFVGEKTSCCAICTLAIDEGSFVYDIPCGHYFHCECLGKWLQLRNSCPTCRKPAI